MGEGHRPGEPGRPGGPGDPAGGLPRARPGPAARLAPDRAALRDHLLRTYIAGDVATPRQSNLRNMRRMADGDPYYQFGLRLTGWTFDRTLAEMARLVGVRPDPSFFYGDDTIDADLTLDALDAAGDRVGKAARDRQAVLLATGHPEALLRVYVPLADALRAAGCRVLTPAEGWTYTNAYPNESTRYPALRTLEYVGGVAVTSAGGAPRHTHDSAPMERMLEVLRANLAGESGYWPDLVIADHGWAGAAGEAGIATVGFADCNDPALFAGHVEGKIEVAVPLDDNVLPAHYDLLAAYLLGRAGLLA